MYGREFLEQRSVKLTENSVVHQFEQILLIVGRCHLPQIGVLLDERLQPFFLLKLNTTTYIRHHKPQLLI